MSDDVTTSEVVYVGRRILSTGKVGYGYRDENGEIGYYKASLATGNQVGQVVTLTRPADRPDSYYSAGKWAPRIVGFIDTIEEADLLRWQVEDRAAYQVKADADAAKRAAERAAHLDSHIEALIEAARGLTGAQRAAFARHVEDRIRGW